MNYIEILNKLKADSPLSNEELESLLAWVLSAEGKRSIEEDILKSWNSFESSETYDYKSLLHKLNQEIDSRQAKRIFLYRKYIRYAMEAAAIIIFAVGISFFITDNMKKKFHQQVLAQNPEMVEIYNPKGLRTTVILPDSSKVILNADSRISYLKNFMPDYRSVQLEGEALFEVTNDSSRPFVVQAYGVKMTVLGTSFNVRSYPESNYIATTLIEGSLRVETERNAYTLLPGNQSRIDKISQKNRIQEVNTENVTGWTDGKLHFQLTPFSEMVAILERAYSVNIHVKNSPLLQKNFTGKFEHGESLEQIMEVLNLSMSSVSTYNKETNTIVIH
ncbi:MAG: DUF4974 domain-containing protein [Prevotellaceae bacterium]|jgi:ferric-dicitrate binding protein FerR (iron transport regulator)|nr:DUF4974 domain-containing protein [Prevotellaceae bacterium]